LQKSLPLAITQNNDNTTWNKEEAQHITTSWHNSGVAGFESSQKLINFGVR
jgi:hypothetical protein